MGLILANTDFLIGKYEVPTNDITKPKITAYIDKYESKYLRDLLGVALFDLFKANLTPGPSTAPYTVLVNPIYADGECGKQYISEGIKEMLKGFLYFEMARDGKVKQTMSGPVVNNPELGENANFSQANIYARYNEAVKSYQTIQWYIKEHKEDYPDYNGQKKGVASQW